LALGLSILVWQWKLLTAILGSRAVSEFMTKREFAEELRVSERTVSNYLKRGWIPGVVRIGPQTVRIPRGAIDSFRVTG